MYIAMNKIAGPGAQNEAVVEGFKRALPGMKQFSGFLGMEIWTQQDGTMLAVSRWSSKEALDEYVNNAAFRSHHGASRAQTGDHGLVTYYESEVLQ